MMNSELRIIKARRARMNHRYEFLMAEIPEWKRQRNDSLRELIDARKNGVRDQAAYKLHRLRVRQYKNGFHNAMELAKEIKQLTEKIDVLEAEVNDARVARYQQYMRAKNQRDKKESQ